ncbi:MAG: superoxide dismutase family protein [Elusimicrobia bacterium]|nr:superoxide dismutase family protein [Elusimicrobiota bacterium]
MSAVLHGLTPGEHGFHIHEFGSCEDSAKAAGGHFNPKKHEHGQALKDGVAKTHAGDLGNITADAAGDAKLDVTLKGVSLTKDFAVAGRAVVVHEKVDDFSQPVGNAGGRVACGVIGLVAPAAPAAK